jgi:hypothetical protein
MYGLVSGVLSLLLIYPVALYLGPSTESFFGFNIFNHFVNNFGYLFMVLIGSGICLGITSSVLAVARYLKV